MPGTNPNPAITNEQFLTGVVSLVHRLGRELDAFERGEPGAADALGGLLRTFLGGGDGNRVVSRLIARFGLAQPWATVSRLPANTPQTLLSIGSLPSTRPPRGPEFDRTIRFAEWVDAPLLLYPGAVRARNSVAQFASDVGNSTGAHLSSTTPDVLERCQMFGLAGVKLREYVTRQLAWQVEHTTTRMLNALTSEVTASERPLTFEDVLVIWFHFRMESATARRSTFDVLAERFPVQVLQWEHEGTHRFWIDEQGHPRWDLPPGFLDRKDG